MKNTKKLCLYQGSCPVNMRTDTEALMSHRGFFPRTSQPSKQPQNPKTPALGGQWARHRRTASRSAFAGHPSAAPDPDTTAGRPAGLHCQATSGWACAQRPMRRTGARQSPLGGQRIGEDAGVGPAVALRQLHRVRVQAAAAAAAARAGRAAGRERAPQLVLPRGDLGAQRAHQQLPPAQAAHLRARRARAWAGMVRIPGARNAMVGLGQYAQGQLLVAQAESRCTQSMNASLWRSTRAAAACARLQSCPALAAHR